MEMIVGKTAGFCYGVKRAVEGTEEQLNKNRKVACLGELVHNKQVIQELEQKGLKIIQNIQEAEEMAIIRAHGVPKQIYELAKNKKIDLIDYTCPNVLKIHEIAQKYAKDGYAICLCGSKSHPENIATISYCGKNYFVVEEIEEAKKVMDQIKENRMKKLLLISQTTYSLEKFHQIEKFFKENLPEEIELVVNNTICKATEFRQKETQEIAKKVECMIIIGGKNSSNTKKLYEIAKQNCSNSLCIETVKDLEGYPLSSYTKIGIMAGASTPQKSIQEVIEYFNHLPVMI